MDKIFNEEKLDSIIHFAAYKAVGESVLNPIKYYENNLENTIVILKLMEKYNVKKFVFSSSACVYKESLIQPIKEDFELGTINPYGSTKLMIEEILKYKCISDKDFSVVVLRYFNPLGAHPSYLIGDDPNGIPANLLPYVAKVAVGELKELNVFGEDYNTVDGTGVRDYIHVVDLAKGHIKAMNKLSDCGIFYYNLGTGVGYSVFQIINEFEKVNNVKIPYKVVERRPGDLGEVYACVEKAEKELGFKAVLGLKDMCYDAYQYIINKNKKR